MFKVWYPFGVELEFSNHSYQGEDIAGALEEILSEGFNRGSETPDRWTFKSDGSCGWELTTPVLRGEAGLDRLTGVVEGLSNRFESRRLVRRSCGLHVHFDLSDFTRKNCLQMLSAFQAIEPLIFNILPPSRATNSYCHRLCRNELERGCLSTEHSRAVNFAGMMWRGDVEIRYGAGTCNPRKVRHWVLFLQGITKAAIELDALSNSPSDISTPDQLERWMGTTSSETMDWVRERYAHFQET